jgi:hypothetical protein
MKTATGNDDLRHEWYGVEIDGKIRSRYGVYVEALKAGMELKQKFPLSLIKVQSFASACAVRVQSGVRSTKFSPAL